MGQNLTTSGKFTWAMSAEGLDPLWKLVLILAANDSDQDGHLFAPFDRLLSRANIDQAMLDRVISGLMILRMATYTLAENPRTGVRENCILLLVEGVADGV